MKRSKKVFLLITLLFLLLLAWIVWDFSHRTEFRRPAPQQEQQQVEQS